MIVKSPKFSFQDHFQELESTAFIINYSRRRRLLILIFKLNQIISTNFVIDVLTVLFQNGSYSLEPPDPANGLNKEKRLFILQLTCFGQILDI